MLSSTQNLFLFALENAIEESKKTNENVKPYCERVVAVVHADASDEKTQFSAEKFDMLFREAVVFNFVGVVKLFIAANAQLAHNQMALHLAICELPDTEILEMLLEQKIDTTVQTGGKTPMHWAAGVGNDRAVTLLFNAGAKLNALDSTARKPLYYAVKHDHWSTVDLLIARGADLNCAPNEPGHNTPLEIALAAGHQDLVIKLLRLECIDLTDEIMRKYELTSFKHVLRCAERERHDAKLEKHNILVSKREDGLYEANQFEFHEAGTAKVTLNGVCKEMSVKQFDNPTLVAIAADEFVAGQRAIADLGL